MRREQLDEAINKKRAEMIKIGMEKGLMSEETIVCSQELDMLLNTYHHLQSKPISSNHINLCFWLFEYIRNQIHKYMISA